MTSVLMERTLAAMADDEVIALAGREAIEVRGRTEAFNPYKISLLLAACSRYPENDVRVSLSTSAGSTTDVAIANAISTVVRAQGRLLIPTAALRLSSFERFDVSLRGELQRCGILVPDYTWGAIATVLYEAATNAEEHGSRILDDQQESRIRLVGISWLREPPSTLDRPDLMGYQDKFVQHYDLPVAGWLHASVVDSGMGIPFPSHRFFAQRQGWSEESWNVYSAPHAVEFERLRRVLNTYESSKGGDWSRSINTVTPPGYGTRLIQHRLGFARGFASVRTGRGRGYWFWGGAHFDSHERGDPPPYEVEAASTTFRGTAWEVLVPLSQQLRLL